ncbi:MAG: lysophospholipid acyltransferase family protein [Bacteroidales bacterium]
MDKKQKLPRLDIPSTGYKILFRLVRFYYHLYYRKINVFGLENIPKDKPVIFAANHQNALMDALAVLFYANRPVVFLARADIFRNKIIARILYFLRILPVYRMRDGVNVVEKNKAVFAETVRLLKNGFALTIMPEGTHSPGKKLQPLKKGVGRIAFQAAEAVNFKEEIYIIPFGIDYEHPDHAGKKLLLNIGKPIALSVFYSDYKHQPQDGLIKLKDSLEEQLKNQIVHFGQFEDSKAFRLLTKLSSYTSLHEISGEKAIIKAFKNEQQLAQNLNLLATQHTESYRSLMAKSNEYLQLLQQNQLHETSSNQFSISAISLFFSGIWQLITFLPWLIGVILNYLPYKIPGIVAGKFKDPQFISSVNFVLSFLLFPIWYLILGIVIYSVSGSIGWTMLGVMLTPYLGLFAFYHFRQQKQFIRLLRWKWFSSRKKTVCKKLIEARNVLQKHALEMLSEKQIKPI